LPLPDIGACIKEGGYPFPYIGAAEFCIPATARWAATVPDYYLLIFVISDVKFLLVICIDNNVAMILMFLSS
jgi:hypothetical protein